METNDLYYMELALEEARKAAALGETPVGAVLVWEGEIAAKAHNRRELDKIATAHAELLAIEAACKALGGWRLHKGALYVTLEPCPMCAGAIVNARIRRLVFAAPDRKAGCCGSVTNLFALPFNHRPEVVGGVCEAEAAALLTRFFRELRQRRREEGKALALPYQDVE